MVPLKEEDLQRVLEKGDPSFDKLLLGRVFAQPSNVEGDDRQGFLRHGLEELRWPTGRIIPGGCPVRALSFAG